MNDINLTSIWPVDSIELQPSIRITNWSIRSVIQNNTESATHHIVGNSIDTYEGLVSSAIQDFSPDKRTVITRSGRKYILIGAAGYDRNSMYVWQNWKHFNEVHSEVDVTNDYAEKLLP